MKINLEGLEGFPTVKVTPDVDSEGNSVIWIEIDDYEVDSNVDVDLDNNEVTLTVEAI